MTPEWERLWRESSSERENLQEKGGVLDAAGQDREHSEPGMREAGICPCRSLFVTPHPPEAPPAPEINPSKDLEMEGKEFTHGDLNFFPLLSKDTVHLLPPFVFRHWDLPAAERPRR